MSSHASDTDSMPLDGDTPLTRDERLAIRRILREEERRSWAMRKLRVLVPILVACVVAVWQVWEWVARHLRWQP